FGSRVKNSHKGYSDIDLCATESDLEYHDLLQLRHELADSNLIYQIDLHDINLISNEKFKQRILDEGKLFYSK
ncbi:MAG: nucleotidyltransferase domain-containing protein, partial [Patescibacteria group bacterium]